MARFPSKWILPGGPSLGNSRAACNFESRPSEKQVGSQLRLGLSSFLVRSRRGAPLKVAVQSVGLTQSGCGRVARHPLRFSADTDLCLLKGLSASSWTNTKNHN